MDDNQKQILSESKKIISKLQILSAFFEDDVIYKIYVRSQVIEKLFEANPELDINKLQLFHLQFTESVLELLRRIKKANEKSVSLTFDEIELNNQLITKISDAMRTEESYEFGKQKQTQKINESLERLYNNLSDLSRDYPFAKNMQQFGGRYAKDFFHEISEDLFYELTAYDPEEVYHNGYGMIEKKLLGLECRYLFNNTFYCGLKAGALLLEVYRLPDDDVFFAYYSSRNMFLSFPFEKIAGIDPTEALSKRAKVVQELTEKNLLLEQQAVKIKTQIPADIKKLLTEYYEKVNSMDFMDFMDDFDVQANILKTMLNTERM
ncbi:hypothetical protein [Taibaiella koreensis]|uniref:hypothetical protein n=1 Tax=Taibaiella koreensis TaxID=1268548 RepID=UPI000E59E1EE|nr:hypothetical protein [Taibaiella koreensis]